MIRFIVWAISWLIALAGQACVLITAALFYILVAQEFEVESAIAETVLLVLFAIPAVLVVLFIADDRARLMDIFDYSIQKSGVRRRKGGA